MSFNKRILSPGGLPFVNSENFGIVTYTGNSGDQSITGLGFQPDFVWIKERSQADNHNVIDSTRGTNKIISPNLTNAEFTSGRFTSFDSDGFTLANNNETNDNGVTYVAWCWKAGGGTTSSNSDGEITTNVQANRDAGFSIVTFDGITDPGEKRSFGHGLSQAPEFIWMKRRGSAQHPAVFAQNGGSWGYFNGTSDNSVLYDYASNITVNSTVIDIVDLAEWFADASSEYVYWCWHSVAGYSKIGTYTGNRTNDVIVETGFEVGWVMIKAVDATDDWFIVDHKRGDTLLYANKTDAETSFSGVTFLSNGFMLNGSQNSGGTNNAGTTFLYMAFAVNPDIEAPTLASSFNIETYTGTNVDPLVVNSLGFKPGLVWIKTRDQAREHIWSDIVRGPNKELSSSDTSAQESRGVKTFDDNGFTLDNSTSNYNAQGENYVAWTWKADDNVPTINTNGSITSITSVNSNAGFSIVTWTGTGANANIGHGLSSTPNFIIMKSATSTGEWLTWHTNYSGGDKYIYLNSTNAVLTQSQFFNALPTSTVFKIGSHGDINASGETIIAYCFHDVTGYQKFGSYSGSGSDGNSITTGFKPDFVMIKRTNDAGGWLLFDTKRSTGNPVDDRLEANNTQAEQTNSNNKYITVSATGFSANNSDTELNASGSTYIYWAIAKNVPSNTTLANSFKAVTYTGNESTRSITGVGFKPDLIWIKERTSTSNHVMFDSVRGALNQLYITTSAVSDNFATVSSFDSDGWTMSNGLAINENSEDYVAWCWKAGNQWQSNIDGTIASLVNVNTANGFSIVKYVGTGSSGSVGHGLSSTPDFITIKRLDGTTNWQTWYTGAGTSPGSGINRLYLNTTDSNDSSTTNVYYPDSTKINLNSGDHFFNTSGANYIAYCWHSVSGYSKIGTYTGNGSASGTVVEPGFSPDFVLVKRTDNTSNWGLFDSQRSGSYYQKGLLANTANTEYAETNVNSACEFLAVGHSDASNGGFRFRDSGSPYNVSSGTYIYMAFKMN